MSLKNKLSLGQYQIDDTRRVITFQDLRYYVTDDGQYFPSVTTILDAYPKTAQFYEWLKKTGEDADTIRDAAGAKGSKIHNLIERYNLGETVSLLNPDGTISYSTAEWGGLEKWVDFTTRFKPTILKSEFNIISPKLGTAGTIDAVIELEGKKLIVDFKTSNAMHDHYFLQLACYKKLYEEAFPDEKIDGAAIIWLSAKTRTEGKTGQYQGKGYQLIFPDKDLEYYWNLFRHTQALWMEVNGDSKPRNLTYKLEYKR